MSLDNVSKTKDLFYILSKFEYLKKFDIEDEPGAWNTAYSLVEIEESIENFKIQLDKLHHAKTEEESEDILQELSHELDHILYHIKDSKYFSYLISDDSSK